MSASNAIPYALFMVVTVAIVVILPVTLSTSSSPSPVAPSTPPMGNETSPPPGALALGASDMFTQRVCPLVGAPLAGRATNERAISNAVFAQNVSTPDLRGLNTFAWAFGQFIDHDVVLSEDDDALVGDSIEMVPNGVGTFIALKRVKTRAGPLGRETFNNLTAHIDASTVYGDYKNPHKFARLRTPSGCRMVMGPGGTPKYDGVDFDCGDVRCSEHAVLTSMHSLFLREHNRWCTHLDTSPYTSGWSEEQKFWKARSLTIAVLQHITYEEWLPALFGSQQHLLNAEGVALKGEYTRIATEFSVATFRFGHSMVANNVGDLPLVTLFFNPAQTISLGVDSILLRALQTHAERVDNMVVDGLRNFLFSTGMGAIGEDLITRNLYRARDVELCSYQDICTCYGTTPSTNDTNRDPMAGLLSEPLVEGSSLPRTIAHILAEQFRRLKENDEFYHTKTAASQLSQDELFLVTRTTFKDLLLRNTALTSAQVPTKAFFL